MKNHPSQIHAIIRNAELRRTIKKLPGSQRLLSPLAATLVLMGAMVAANAPAQAATLEATIQAPAPDAVQAAPDSSSQWVKFYIHNMSNSLDARVRTGSATSVWVHSGKFVLIDKNSATGTMYVDARNSSGRIQTAGAFQYASTRAIATN